MVIPSIGLVQLAYASKADRYAYLPTYIFYVMIGTYIFRYFINAMPNKLILSTAGAIAFVYGGYLATTTVQHVKQWKNDELLWQRVVNLYPDTATIAYNNLGNINYEREKYHDAIELYKKAIETNPSKVIVYGNISNAYIKLRQLDMVLKYYREAIKNNPENPQAYQMLGDHYYRNNKLSVASDIYQRMLELDPANPGALLRNSLIDIAQGKPKSALKKVDYYLMLRPNSNKAKKLKENILANVQQIPDLDEYRDTASHLPSYK
jgi:tetratricopeptide (TPR) repeat protein